MYERMYAVRTCGTTNGRHEFEHSAREDDYNEEVNRDGVWSVRVQLDDGDGGRMRVFKTYVFKTEAEADKWREAAAKCEFGLLVVYPVIFVPFRTFEESTVAEAAEQLLVERDRRRSI